MVTKEYCDKCGKEGKSKKFVVDLFGSVDFIVADLCPLHYKEIRSIIKKWLKC